MYFLHRIPDLLFIYFFKIVLNSVTTKLKMTFLVLPLLTNYIMNAKFGLLFSVMYKNGFKMSVPANDITDFHVKMSWEFIVYFG